MNANQMTWKLLEAWMESAAELLLLESIILERPEKREKFLERHHQTLRDLYRLGLKVLAAECPGCNARASEDPVAPTEENTR